MTSKDKKYIEHADMSKYSPVKIGGIIDRLYLINSLQDLQETMRSLREENLPFFVFGNASKMLFPDFFSKKAAIKVVAKNMEFEEDKVYVEAGVSLSYFARLMVKKGYVGFEGLTMIPGALGGSLVNNAGAFGSTISDMLIEVFVVDNEGNLRRYKKEELDFAYRTSRFKKENLGIIYQLVFHLQKGDEQSLEERKNAYEKKRKASQPHGILTFGSTFKNPSFGYAGEWIEKAGLKGFKRGHVSISQQHANFLEISSEASAKEVRDLIAFIKDEVYNKYSVILEPEVIIEDGERHGGNRNESS